MESVLLPALASALGSDYARIENFTPGIWSDPRSLAVLGNIAKIYSGDYLMPGTVALNHTDSQAAQMQNKALFIPNGTWMEDEMADVARAPGYRFGLTPPPVMRNGDTRYVAAYTEQFSIPAGAKNPAAAKLFMRYLYTDKVIEMYARLNNGAVMATKNALEIAKPHISDGTYGMFGAFNEPGATALIFGFAAPPDGTKIVYSDEIYKPLSDVMTGKMTAAQWAANIDQAYQDMKDGK
jgi:N-acetylglucosamine transport system substrate-binding protein